MDGTILGHKLVGASLLDLESHLHSLVIIQELVNGLSSEDLFLIFVTSIFQQ